MWIGVDIVYAYLLQLSLIASLHIHQFSLLLIFYSSKFEGCADYISFLKNTVQPILNLRYIPYYYDTFCYLMLLLYLISTL
ncbi:hypothetical protein [Vibrio phage S4-7]|nr:hypothetical protein [Vibrio phage S4-7]